MVVVLSPISIIRLLYSISHPLFKIYKNIFVSTEFRCCCCCCSGTNCFFAQLASGSYWGAFRLTRLRKHLPPSNKQTNKQTNKLPWSRLTVETVNITAWPWNCLPKTTLRMFTEMVLAEANSPRSVLANNSCGKRGSWRSMPNTSHSNGHAWRHF